MIQVRSVPHGVNATVAGTFEPRQPAGGGNLVGRPGRIEVGAHAARRADLRGGAEREACALPTLTTAAPSDVDAALIGDAGTCRAPRADVRRSRDWERRAGRDSVGGGA